jgi:hypothetical protein
LSAPRSRTPLLAVALAIGLLAGLLLTACGGSSSSSTAAKSPGAAAPTGPATTSPTATTPTTGTTTTKAPSAQATAYRKCLEAHGAGLPRLIPAPGGGLGAVAGGHLAPPKGVSQKTYEAAVRACGAFGKNTSQTIGVAVQRFVACMRANGVKVPRGGKGKGGVLAYLGQIQNPKFESALKKCEGPLRAATGTAPKK